MNGFHASGTLAALALCMGAGQALAQETQPASTVVTQIRSATTTDGGQPITLPEGNVTVVASTYEIPAGATLPVHKHPSARYAYVLSGELRVTNDETGEATDYKAGDFVVELIDTWHLGTNTGTEVVRLLVIDQVGNDGGTVVLKE